MSGRVLQGSPPPSSRLRPVLLGAGLPRPEVRVTGWLLRDAVRSSTADGASSTVSLVLCQPNGLHIHAHRHYSGGTGNFQAATNLAAGLRRGMRITVWGHRLSVAKRDGDDVLLLEDVTLIDGIETPRGASA